VRLDALAFQVWVVWACRCASFPYFCHGFRHNGERLFPLLVPGALGLLISLVPGYAFIQRQLAAYVGAPSLMKSCFPVAERSGCNSVRISDVPTRLVPLFAVRVKTVDASVYLHHWRRVYSCLLHGAGELDVRRGCIAIVN
jgi:hypothetical protein